VFNHNVKRFLQGVLQGGVASFNIHPCYVNVLPQGIDVGLC
jgi:hypothetical protein